MTSLGPCRSPFQYMYCVRALLIMQDELGRDLSQLRGQFKTA